MQKKMYPVEIGDIPGLVCYYPSEMELDSTINQVCYGSRCQAATFKKNTSVKQHIILSRTLAESIKFFHPNNPYHLFIFKGNLHIGPLLGIFTAGFSSTIQKPIGERSSFFAKLLSLNAATGCMSFVFGEHHIDWENEVIRGCTFIDNEWNIAEFPFPNVVYDRLPNRKSEARPQLKEVKQKLQEKYRIPWFNPGFFNKWDIYNRLSDNPKASPFMPETYPFTSLSTVERMLSVYRHVYIKPIFGSLGLGIHQVIYDKYQNVYYCRYKDDQKANKLQKFPTLEYLMNHIFSNKRIDNLIVQQGITLLRHDKRAIDFRVHTNKNVEDKWQVTAIAAKIAGPGSVTTHVKYGGEIKALDEIFDDKEFSAKVRRKLSEAAITLSECIEQNLEGVIAEIGFDFGVDKHGNVWMFEANSKPGRSIFNHPQLKESDILTRQLCLEYAVYLTEQSLAGKEIKERIITRKN